MKRVCAFILMLLVCTGVVAQPIEKIVFFGDSLTDNGNLYRTILHILPKSPPYYQGRFSNGPIWAEIMTDYFKQNGNISSENYAVGGATALFHVPRIDFIAPTTLSLEVSGYLLNSIFQEKQNVLYVIWIGGNDYIFNEDTKPESITTRVVNRIAENVNMLVAHGAKNFLILNIPDVSRIPRARQKGHEERLHDLIELHNQKLALSVAYLRKMNPDTHIIFSDVNYIFNEFLNEPEVYNKAYFVNVKNTVDACWNGKLTLKQFAKVNPQELNMVASRADKEMTARLINSNPELLETYQVGKMQQLGVQACENPDEFLFWDRMHPTAVVHRVLAQIMIGQLQRELFNNG